MRKNIVCLMASLVIVACAKKEPVKKPKPILPFPVVKVSKQEITTFEEFPASIEGKVNSEVRPKIPGYIKQVLVKEGEAVRKNQLLFRLETETLSQDAQAARANYHAAQVEVDKLKPLVEKDIISNVQLETANAKLAQARSAYNSVLANIDYANIKSPVNGVVGSINFREGSLVSAQDPTPITNVSAIGEVYAYFSMNEKEFITFMEIAKGDSPKEKLEKFPKVKLRLATGDIYKHTGSIETITGDINKQTGTITFRAKFENEARLLRNGSSGTVLIPKTFVDAIVVPAESTFERQGKTLVYKVVNDSLVPNPISIAKDTERLFIVKSGINVGDIILAKGLNRVAPGTKIKPVTKPLDSIINSFETVFK